MTAGDACVSLQDGSVLGVFAPGEHRLPAEIPPGVELWFCSQQSFTGNKVGGLVMRARVFGDYSYRISAPHLLVAAAVERDMASDPVSYLNRMVISAIGDALMATPANAQTLADATPVITTNLNAKWAELGVTFEGFERLSGR